ncbi:MAG: hypothetical protein FJ295_14780 [Planctomycetes bacterium]|nr:hypothetical protein [Planctomycetota bacterium]
MKKTRHTTDQILEKLRQADVALGKEQQDDEILVFAKYWKERTAKFPEELIFDLKLTTHSSLNRLNKQNINFITLRRGSISATGRSRCTFRNELTIHCCWRLDSVRPTFVFPGWGNRLHFVFG